ncbi:hypothetical protein BFJ66_g1299 [Fusarium oxysporum f. sp. cepae]|nr:hypothetical protein BFJ66_g1299 [Fusarium oxysporum f. sp. cepae]
MPETQWFIISTFFPFFVFPLFPGRQGIVQLWCHQLRSSKISLVLYDASILYECRVSHYPFRDNLSCQTRTAVIGIGKETCAVRPVAKKFSKSAVRKNIDTVVVNMQFHAFFLG